MKVSNFASMLETRDKIIELAEFFIRTKGYNAFSYRDIAEKLQIKNAAIHHHFRSKADLGKAVITLTRDKFRLNTNKWQSQAPRERLQAFMDIYTSMLEQNLVCFMGALGPAFHTLPEIMQQELTLAGQEIRSWLRQVLKEGHQQKQFNFKEPPHQKADLIISALLASLILSRVTQANLCESVNQAIIQHI